MGSITKPVPVAQFARTAEGETRAWRFVEREREHGRETSLTFERDRIDAYQAIPADRAQVRESMHVVTSFGGQLHELAERETRAECACYVPAGVVCPPHLHERTCPVYREARA